MHWVCHYILYRLLVHVFMFCQNMPGVPGYYITCTIVGIDIKLVYETHYFLTAHTWTHVKLFVVHIICKIAT